MNAAKKNAGPTAQAKKPHTDKPKTTSAPPQQQKKAFTTAPGAGKKPNSNNNNNNHKKEQAQDLDFAALGIHSRSTSNKKVVIDKDIDKIQQEFAKKFDEENKQSAAKKQQQQQKPKNDDIPQVSKPATGPRQPLPTNYTEEEMKRFAAEARRLNQLIDKELKYLPQLGSAEKTPRYKPFINAITNIGGCSRLQLYQLHQYTQLLLASQRHKIDLTKTSDGYYKNEIFPPLSPDFPILNVTSLRIPHLIFNGHIADALSLIPTIEAQCAKLRVPELQAALKNGVKPASLPLEIADVGSGGGIPAIILAIMRPAWNITAIDSVKKKCNFLRFTADLLQLPNFCVVSGAVQHYTVGGTLAEPHEPIKMYGNVAAQGKFQPKINMFQAYDFCVARGVTQMPELFPFCMPLVKRGGKFIAMKSLLSSLGRANSEENDQVNEALARSLKTDDDLKALSKDIKSEQEKFFKEQQKTTTVKDEETGKKMVVKNWGEKFKQTQVEFNKTLSNFDAVLNKLLGLPWQPQGNPYPHYQLLSLELAEGIPMLPELGASEKVLYVNTDLFFKVPLPAANSNINVLYKDGLLIPKEDVGVDEVTEKKVMLKYKSLFPHLNSTSADDSAMSDELDPKKKNNNNQDDTDSEDDSGDLDSFIKQQAGKKQKEEAKKDTLTKLFQKDTAGGDDEDEEGKVGETSKYLCIVDKVLETNLSTLEKPRVCKEQGSGKKNKQQQKDRLNTSGPETDHPKSGKADGGDDEEEEENEKEVQRMLKNVQALKTQFGTADSGKHWSDVEALLKNENVHKSSGAQRPWLDDDWTKLQTVKKWQSILAGLEKQAPKDAVTAALRQHLQAHDESWKKHQEKSAADWKDGKEQAKFVSGALNKKMNKKGGDDDKTSLADQILRASEKKQADKENWAAQKKLGGIGYENDNKKKSFDKNNNNNKKNFDNKNKTDAFANTTNDKKRKRTDEYAQKTDADDNNAGKNKKQKQRHE